jgi:hypothetical protein
MRSPSFPLTPSAAQASKNYTNSEDNQLAVSNKVVEGEHPWVSLLHLPQPTSNPDFSPTLRQTLILMPLAAQASKTYTNSEDNQLAVSNKVFEGERELTKKYFPPPFTSPDSHAQP